MALPSQSQRSRIDFELTSGCLDRKLHRSRILHAAAGIQNLDADNVACGVVIQDDTGFYFVRLIYRVGRKRLKVPGSN